MDNYKNLGSICQFIDHNDRHIIIEAMQLYKIKATRGMSVPVSRIPENMVWSLNPFTVRKALCFELKDDNLIALEKQQDHERERKINRLIKLCDSILPRPPS